mmetsp:Transcript_80659/g.211745  ORF Transcript_80659/g.211745 Transcript_80659/m.211745 type:complete len:260 (-) Transcript_80659:28-807(-)
MRVDVPQRLSGGAELLVDLCKLAAVNPPELGDVLDELANVVPQALGVVAVQGLDTAAQAAGGVHEEVDAVHLLVHRFSIDLLHLHQLRQRCSMGGQARKPHAELGARLLVNAAAHPLSCLSASRDLLGVWLKVVDGPLDGEQRCRQRARARLGAVGELLVALEVEGFDGVHEHEGPDEADDGSQEVPQADHRPRGRNVMHMRLIDCGGVDGQQYVLFEDGEDLGDNRPNQEAGRELLQPGLEHLGRLPHGHRGGAQRHR